MTSAVTISALAPHVTAAPADPADLPVRRPHLSVVETAPAETPAARPEPAASTKVASATADPGRVRRTLAALVAELTELDSDHQVAGQMKHVTDWLAEIASQRTALRARARILCTELGQHQTGGCPSCCPPPPRTGAR